MTTFIGTFKEFCNYLNDFVKNKVPYLTRKHKNCTCELCRRAKATDAAHKHGRERIVLIREAFDIAIIKQEGGQAYIDLDKFAASINRIHSDPDNFHFLCKQCHKAYDSPNSTVREEDFAPRKTNPTNRVKLFPECYVPTGKHITFEQYLSMKGYSSRTIKAYASTAPLFLLNNFHVDIYKENDSSKILILLQSLLGNPAFVAIDNKCNHIYSCGLKRYAEYLQYLVAH